MVDPTINENFMEMYADDDSRGGVLEPEGTVDVKFRKEDMVSLAHRLDPTLIQLDQQLDGERKVNSNGGQESPALKAIQTKIKQREQALLPMYHQAATAFCDLHDTPGRMKAKGVIRAVVKWSQSRSFFYFRLRLKLLEFEFIKKILATQRLTDDATSWKQASALFKEWITKLAANQMENLVENDRKMFEWLDSHRNELENQLNLLKESVTRQELESMVRANPDLFVRSVSQVLSLLSKEQRASLV